MNCVKGVLHFRGFDIWRWRLGKRSILLESEGGKVTEQIAEIIGELTMAGVDIQPLRERGDQLFVVPRGVGHPLHVLRHHLQYGVHLCFNLKSVIIARC